jgi:hypothetical protein
VGALGESVAIAANGTIYVAGENLTALNPDGTQAWVYVLGTANPASPTIAADGTIYVASASSSSLYAINPDGTEKWAFVAPEAPYDSPIVGSDGTIYFASYYHLNAVNPDGSAKWVIKPNVAVSSPALGPDGTIYFYAGGSLYAVHPDSVVAWNYMLDNDAAINSPVVGVDGTIYAESSLTAAPPELYAIAPNGTLRWKVSTSYDPGPLALGPDGSIYLGAGAFRAFAPDGTTKWSLNVPDGGAAFWGTPAVDSAGTVYAAWQSQAEGAILAVGPNGVVNWSVGVAWSAEDALGQDPVAACAIGANGLLYAGQGTLYAVGP